MRDLLTLLRQYEPFKDLGRRIEAGGESFVEGMWGSSTAYLIAALAAERPRTFLCLLPHIETAEQFAEDLELFSPGLPMFFPVRETLAEEHLPDADILSQRIGVVKDLARRRQSGGGARVVVAPIQAALQRVPSDAMLAENVLLIRKGMDRSPDDLCQWLVGREFQPVRQVEVPGEFCRRGGILDVYPWVAERPVRIEFFGDEVESLRTFDLQTQMSVEHVDEVSLTALPRQTSDATRGTGWSTLFDHLPPDTLIVFCEPAELMSRARAFAERDRETGAREDAFLARFRDLSLGELQGLTANRPRLHVASLPGAFGGQVISFHVHSIERFGGEMSAAVKEIELAAHDRRRVMVLCANAGEQKRLIEILGASPVLTQRNFEIRLGKLHHGFDWSDLSLALLSHHEIFRRYRERRAAPRFRHTRAIESFYDLQPGDLVVHVAHGIGIFRGMEMIEREGRKEECLRIEYAEQAMLFVPASRIELTQKYVGPSEHQPPLSTLGSGAWARRKAQAEAAVRDMAADLVRLQAVREASPGIAHPADGEWQREFENAFPYEETEDQLRVAEEVKRDMEATRPADRLICGDVGYGKTEVAMRAAFKAATGGRQVAVLVPTTVLAAQHLQTFRERMADYPITIEMLSRFVTRGDQSRILERLEDGRVDIVIGTHRLVQADVRFKDLGLVIIDEEQRFGVAHKEQLKRLRSTVDVLTLTATPIPRTLHMSMLGIRDISSLDTPIRDRLAIRTSILRYDPSRIRQAILHEMAREGQVFFVHNRVENIHRIAEEIAALVPEAVVAVGHGQMPERELGRVMGEFRDGKADVLVCTTIIESGLDIPNANTIIINEADLFGLADLHQLRGRVGRYKHRAYAYLLLPRDRPIAPVAEKRLKAIEEFSDLGAGFRISMRDLEIRGAGNILGAEQSGHLAAVGYDLYCRILERAVREMKNEPVREPPEVSLALGTEAYLPESYIPDDSHRIDFYRQLHRAAGKEEVEVLAAVLRDRFGPPPREVKNLLAEARLRLLAQDTDITRIALQPETLTASERAARFPIVINATRIAALTPILDATDQMYRVIDENTLHLRPRAEQRRPRDARISGEMMVSFLIQALEIGLAHATKHG